jgi:hypothetical protein
MNETPNVPLPVPPPEPAAPPSSMFQIWMDAVTKPRESTFARIASSPNATTTNAFLWVFLAALVSSFFSIIGQGATINRLIQQQGLGNELGNTLPSGGGSMIFQVICGAPIVAVITVVFFAIGVALVQWVARMFGGHGTYEKLAYTFAAIAAPISIVSGLISLLGAIPFIGACFAILGVALGIYALVLQIMAAKAVNGFASYGPAVGSVLIPGAVIFLICCCLAFAVASLAGVALGNVFSSGGMPFPIPTP